jgi:hypothetical protein
MAPYDYDDEGHAEEWSADSYGEWLASHPDYDD